MQRMIRAGSMIIRTGTMLPGAVKTKTVAYTTGWDLVVNTDGYAMERALRCVGWSLFFVALQIKAVVLGAWGPANQHRLMQRLLRKVRLTGFNCLQITEVCPKSFLGIPYIAVTAHSRHAQEGSTLNQKQQRNQDERATAWAIG